LEQVTALDDHRRLPAAWRKLAAVETAFARAYAELAGYRRAIDHYRRALVHEDGGVSLADVEQLANMEVRWGEREGKVATVEKGLRRLRKLLALGRTSERLSLLGAGFKRLAKMRSGKARIEALERMRDAYREGYELKHEAEGEVDTYPLLNYLTGRVLVRDKDDDLADLPALLEAAERAAAERFQRRPDFWNAIIPADIALVRSLAAGDLGEADRRRAIVEGYLAGRTRASSPREFDSVLEHVDFLIAVRCDPELTGGRSAPAKRAKAECEALRALEEALAASGDVSS
jgi:tetratricopeptide (TPR) repeat protein